jgi:hypothetical protein
MSYSDKINKYINTKEKAEKFLTKAKYLTKDFKVPLYTGSEEDIKPKQTAQEPIELAWIDHINHKYDNQVEETVENRKKYVQDVYRLSKDRRYGSFVKRDLAEIKPPKPFDNADTSTYPSNQTIEDKKKIKDWEDVQQVMTPQDKFKFSKLDNNSSYQKIWEKIMDSDSSPEEKTNTRRTLNNAYNNPILRKNMSQKELAYINKLPKKEVVEEKKPVEATYIPTEQREDVTAIVKRMADAKLKEEQDNWKKSFGNGGIPSLLKP